MEEWKEIKGYEGLYQVSNYGRVKSLKFGKERTLKAGKDRKGYLRVNLYKDGCHTIKTIHRLVAEAFIPNPSNLPQINHKDENPSNNSVDNLEWCTAEYNINFGTRNKRSATARSKKVLQFKLTGELVQEWPSLSEVYRQMDWNQTNISKCCNGKLNSAYNHLWRYA